MKATVLDVVTGITREVDGPRSWEWAENNFSCDCNRKEDGLGDETGVCEGAKRFLVVTAEFNDPEDYEYTLEELNAEYPEELKQRYLSTTHLN